MKYAYLVRNEITSTAAGVFVFFFGIVPAAVFNSPALGCNTLQLRTVSYRVIRSTLPPKPTVPPKRAVLLIIIAATYRHALMAILE